MSSVPQEPVKKTTKGIKSDFLEDPPGQNPGHHEQGWPSSLRQKQGWDRLFSWWNMCSEKLTVELISKSAFLLRY